MEQSGKSTKETKKVQRRKYDADFKQAALREVENGRSVSDVALGLGISKSLLYKWREAARKQAPPTDSQEVEAMRKRIKDLEKDCEILKKALSILSRTG